MVTILVGSGKHQKQYYIYESLLRRRSKYFEGLTSTNDKYIVDGENLELLVHFQYFDLYIHHLYTGEIACQNEDSDTQDRALFRFHCLAQKLGDPITMQAVMRAFIQDYNDTKVSNGKLVARHYSDMIEFAFQSFGANSPLGNVFVDMCIWEHREITEYEHFSKEVLMKIMHRAIGRANGTVPRTEAKNASCCDYHQLEDGMQCESTKRKRARADDAGSDGQ